VALGMAWSSGPGLACLVRRDAPAWDMAGGLTIRALWRAQAWCPTEVVFSGGDLWAYLQA